MARIRRLPSGHRADDVLSPSGLELDERAFAALDDPKPLEYRGDLEGVKQKLVAAGSPRERKRILESAAVPLGKTRRSEALVFLADLARDPKSHWGIRSSAIRGLGKAGAAGVPYLKSLIASGSVDAGLPWALADAGSRKDADALLPFLDRRGLRLRINTVSAFEQLEMRPDHEGIVRALGDPRFLVRARAFVILKHNCSDLQIIEILETAKRCVPRYRLFVRWNLSRWQGWASRPRSQRSP